MTLKLDLADMSEDVDLIRATTDRILSEIQCFSLKDLSVDGKDLIELVYEEGKEIGEMK